MAEQWDEDEVELEDLAQAPDDRQHLVQRHSPSIDITRERLDEVRFEAGFSRVPKSLALRERMKAALPPEPVRSALIPPLTAREWLEFLLIHVPIIRWVWTYQAKFLVGDIIAGITVAIMHIPQGLAYALLANLDPVYGLYTSFMPAIIYSFLGTSRHISVGTFAVVQLMIGNSIDKILASDPRLRPCLDIGDSNQSNMSDVMTDQSDMSGVMPDMVNSSDINCSAEKVSIAVTIALVSGVIMLVMGIAKLGFITIFLSESLVSGYTTGAACHVFTSQLTHILGIDNKVTPGVLQLPRIWIKSLTNLSQTNWATLIISVLAIIALIFFRLANKYVQKLHVPLPYYSRGQQRWRRKRVKWSIPIPSQLILVIVCTLISYLAAFEDKFDVIIVGDIPQGAPAVTNPFTGYILTVIQDSFVIAIVAYSVSVSLAQVFARKYEYSIHSNQEFIACGAMNIVGSLFSSFTAAGSLSRSLVQANSGGKTQLVGFVSSGIILVVLLWLGALFSPLPRAVLAAIVWVALYGMFAQVQDIWKYFKLSFSDMLIWLVVFFATVFLGVDLGLGVGVAFSLLLIIVRTILPSSSVLGQAGSTEIYRSKEVFQVETIPGVIIYRFMAPICFVNAAVFRKRLEMVSDLHKRPKPGGEEKGCLQKLLPPPENCLRRRLSYAVNKNMNEEEGYVTGTPQGTGVDGHVSMENSTVSDRDLRVAPRPKPTQLVHTVIIDCAPVGFLDSVGVKTLKQIVLDFDKCDVQVLFAAMTKENRDMLDRAKFYEACGKEWLFPSIQDAVHHAQFGDKLHPAGRDEESLATALGSVPAEDGESQSQGEEGRVGGGGGGGEGGGGGGGGGGDGGGGGGGEGGEREQVPEEQAPAPEEATTSFVEPTDQQNSLTATT